MNPWCPSSSMEHKLDIYLFTACLEKWQDFEEQAQASSPYDRNIEEEWMGEGGWK